MARRPRQEEERSMDSLMDAMTNVVGILLLILIVSSLGITAAVKKIVENMPDVTPEMLETLKASREKTLRNLEELKSTQSSVIESQIKPEDAQQLALDLDKFEKENADLAEKTSDLDELLAKAKELEPIKEEKEDRNTAAVKELNDLKAALADKPEVEAPPAREITLPDPRPADPEAYVYYVACRNKKLYIIGEPYQLMLKLRDALDQNFTSLAYRDGQVGSYVFGLQSTRQDENDRFINHIVDYRARSRREREALSFMRQITLKTRQAPDGISVFNYVLGGNEEQQEAKKEWPVFKMRLDQKKVKDFFAQNANRGELTYTPVFEGDRIKVEVGFNPEGGMTEEEFLKRGSPFVELVKQASVNRRVILMYYVKSDSFDTYLKARAYSTSQRVPAGWILSDSDRIPNLGPNKRRETIDYDLNALPEADYLKLVQFVGPKVAEKINKHIEEFDAEMAKVQPPKELKEPEAKAFMDGVLAEREIWANQMTGDFRAIYIAPLAASEATTSKETVVDLHPPYIPHIRTFVPRSAPPSAPRPKPTGGPRKPKGKDKGSSLILD